MQEMEPGTEDSCKTSALNPVLSLHIYKKIYIYISLYISKKIYWFSYCLPFLRLNFPYILILLSLPALYLLKYKSVFITFDNVEIVDQ